jgi:hypothetical protein
MSLHHHNVSMLLPVGVDFLLAFFLTFSAGQSYNIPIRQGGVRMPKSVVWFEAVIDRGDSVQVGSYIDDIEYNRIKVITIESIKNEFEGIRVEGTGVIIG